MHLITEIPIATVFWYLIARHTAIFLLNLLDQ